MSGASPSWLCCCFVTVTSAGWDMHGNASGIDDGMPLPGPAVDKAASAFLEVVEARGPSEKILLVVTGELGSAPGINRKGGRDHRGNLAPIVFAGGGLRMGQVVGGSDSKVSRPATTPISTANVNATILHTLFDVGQLRVNPGLPRELVVATVGTEPIGEIV